MKKTLIALFFISYISASFAADPIKTFGDWFVIQPGDGDGLIAATVNDSESILAFRCYHKAQKCIHVLHANITCSDDGEYPVLVNSDLAAVAMDAVCGNVNQRGELYLTQYDTIHEILQKGNDIGFAIPMESGRFKAVRFSLNGSGKAMNYVEKQVASSGNQDSYL